MANRMLDIYVAHSTTGFDYQKGLYLPIRKSRLNEEHRIILPHEHGKNQFNSKEFLRDVCNLVIAESSIPKEGKGIELGWADAFGVPIICIYRRNSEPSTSLQVITDKLIEYSSQAEMISKLEKAVDEMAGKP